jgi:hypothetical protein
MFQKLNLFKPVAQDTHRTVDNYWGDRAAFSKMRAPHLPVLYRPVLEIPSRERPKASPLQINLKLIGLKRQLEFST